MRGWAILISNPASTTAETDTTNPASGLVAINRLNATRRNSTSLAICNAVRTTPRDHSIELPAMTSRRTEQFRRISHT